MRRGVLLFALLPAAVAAAATPTTLPSTAPPGVSPALWQQMQSIDAAAAAVQDLSADFEQRKFTPLLKQPMVSTGSVLAKGDRTLWETRTPQATVMAVDARQVTIDYPDQHAAEVYPLSGVLAQLTASPVPRLGALLQQFSIAPADPRPLLPPGTTSTAGLAAFALAPTAADLKQHVQQVSVLIDAQRGLILLLQLVDADGETTQLRFLNLKTNEHPPDDRLILRLPPGTAVTHPLDNLGGGLP